MSVLTLEGVVEEGQIRLGDGVILPDKSRVYVVVPDAPTSAARVMSSRLADPASAPTAARRDSDHAGEQPEKMRLAEEQYRLAGKYPDEYVVLVGERTIHHSPDRQEAIAAFQRAALDFPPHRPVFIRPGGRLRKPPVVRGRSLSGKLRRRQ